MQRKLANERGYKIAADVKYKSNSPSLTAEVQAAQVRGCRRAAAACYTNDAILLIKTMGGLGYKPKAIIAQAAGFSEKSVYDAVGDKLQGLISRASFSLDLAAKRPSVGIVNACSRQARRSRPQRQYLAPVHGMLVLADALDRAGSTDGAKMREALAATDIPGSARSCPGRE